MTRHVGPDVVPLQVSGAADNDMTAMTANELMLWGLANLWQEGQEGGYAVRHGQQPVRDFGRAKPGEQLLQETDEDTNYFEKAFPCLYPYSCGGIEHVQPVRINFTTHIRWALCYHDKRFRRHETFPFVAFGILQHRQSLGSARLQMHRSTFKKDARMLSSLTIAKLQQAQKEEESGQAITDPAVRLLRQHIYATGGRVMGSDQARNQLRRQIWSTSIMLNPPTLWITINPCDLHDPIAQVFAGEHIHLDRFNSMLGPSKDKRAQNVAADPYAAAKFFHFMIQTTLETLFGAKVATQRMQCTNGIFGQVTAYFGVVESQAQATLHLHLLLWLLNAPSTMQMEILLKQEQFRKRVTEFISANIHAYLPGMESADSIKTIPNEVEVAYSQPPNPNAQHYDDLITEMERQVVRLKNLHTCAPRRCLIPSKQGGLVCRRRAPFERSDDDSINEDGKWGPKRLYEFMNAWCPALSINLCCNNDIKLLTNARDTMNITYYITSYQTKKQGRNYNMSAVLAKGFAYHTKQTTYLESLWDQHRLLLFRLMQTINCEQELAAPMVMLYLMGWGDTYWSHHYTPIYWSSFVSSLIKVFPELTKRSKEPEANDHSTGDSVAQQTAQTENENTEVKYPMFYRTETACSDERCQQEGECEMVTLDVNERGKITTKSQVTDYRLRGDALAQSNVIDFFVDLYEINGNSPNSAIESAFNDAMTSSTPSQHIQKQKRQPGRPAHSHVPYLPAHPKSQSKQRILR